MVDIGIIETSREISKFPIALFLWVRVRVPSRRTKVMPLSLNVISIRSRQEVKGKKTTLCDNYL